MATIGEHRDKVKSLSSKKLHKDLFAFIRSIEKYIISLNQKQIEEDSQDIYGNPIGFYSFATELASGGEKMAGDPFTGVDTHKWFDGFYMQEVAGVLRINSKDPKTSLILASDNWLSDDLFGLTDKHLKQLIETQILPFIIENSRQILDI